MDMYFSLGYCYTYTVDSEIFALSLIRDFFSFPKYSRVHEFASECSIKSNNYPTIGVFIIGENFEFPRQRIREH